MTAIAIAALDNWKGEEVLSAQDSGIGQSAGRVLRNSEFVQDEDLRKGQRSIYHIGCRSPTRI
jgi:hypothetical protein